MVTKRASDGARMHCHDGGHGVGFSAEMRRTVSYRDAAVVVMMVMRLWKPDGWMDAKIFVSGDGEPKSKFLRFTSFLPRVESASSHPPSSCHRPWQLEI